jgi:hypothetical protein
MQEEGTNTYQLHLMLHSEELIFNIKAGVGAIWKTGDQLEARDEVGIILGNLVDEGTLRVGGWLWKSLRLLKDDA